MKLSNKNFLDSFDIIEAVSFLFVNNTKVSRVWGKAPLKRKKQKIFGKFENLLIKKGFNTVLLTFTKVSRDWGKAPLKKEEINC